MASSAALEQKSNGAKSSVSFLLDTNLGLHPDKEPWSDVLSSLGIHSESTTDLKYLDEELTAHKPDIAYIPAADFHRLVGKGDRYYKGFVIATSKFTGEARLKSLLVVRKDDPANSLDDLEGAKYAYINRSCSSSYFPPALLLNKQGKKLEDFFDIHQVKVGPTWQELIDAVVNKDARATMVLEDTWKLKPENAQNTKAIGEYAGGTPAVVVIRDGLDEEMLKKLMKALVEWVPAWDAGVYGPLKPYYNSDVFHFFHELDALPPGL